MAYGLIKIGPLRALAGTSEEGFEPEDSLSVVNGSVWLRVGTHTGVVELESRVLDSLPEPPTGRAAAGEATLSLDEDHELFASTFGGLVDAFSIELPAGWKSVRLRATSERYFEASMVADSGELDSPERIVIEVAPA